MRNDLRRQTSTSVGAPTDADPVTVSLEAVLRLLETQDSVITQLDTLCRQVVQAFTGAETAAITLLRAAGPATVVATSDEVARLREVSHSDAAQPSSFLSVPLRDGGPPADHRSAGVEMLGALNLYGTRPHAFDDIDQSVLGLYVDAASVALRHARRCEEARNLVQQLRIANDSRAVIDQAKGIVMALRGVDAGAAFDVLVARSQQENVKLRVVAEQVVQAVARHAPVGNAL
ncbi:GAF and ANTAR domain-containing protein [Rhodococcus tibetensis]|uniref:GAF and ANTAR domain-containing protein n=1 Tax=Rhodococcus tibetensis TaxID=2965064 RepID=A0ABT1QF53_9NOCA|nr:GAF and ANTAR domain-containing protein [Rhodococcus sp. FXJ9.536]MCQ4120832.1 GAF and ANTAR domain-containing protein [Rhodococcus sp. FXJ9.536]